MECTPRDIAKMIDHSLLRPTLSVDELEQGIRLARQYDVASVCIMPYYLKRCAELLAGSTVHAGTTIGCTRTAEILEECKRRIRPASVPTART